MTRIALTLAATLLASAASAASLYSEDFSGQAGEGLVGANPPATYAAANGQWSLARNAAQLTAASDWARVNTAGQFEFRDTDAPSNAATGYLTWTSSVIDAGGFTNLTLSIDLSAQGDFEFGGAQGNDDLFVSALLDGVETRLFDYVTTRNPADRTLNLMLGDASTVQIRVAANNRAGSEYLRFDNVSLTGDAVSAPVPLPASALLLAGALGGLGLIRRR